MRSFLCVIASLVFFISFPCSALAQQPAGQNQPKFRDEEQQVIPTANAPQGAKEQPAHEELPDEDAGFLIPGLPAKKSPADLPAPAAPASPAADSGATFADEAGDPAPGDEFNANELPTPGATPQGVTRKGRREELMYLESALAESRYMLNPDEEKRDLLITTYEKLVSFYCMPQLLPLLRHEAPAPNPDCQIYLEKLLAINDANAMAACARIGIDSAPCLQAFERQEVATFGSSIWPKGSSGSEQLKATVSLSRNDQRLKALGGQLDPLINLAKYDPKKKQEHSPAIKSLYSQLLNLACHVSTIRLVPMNEAEIKALKEKALSNRLKDSAFKDVISELEALKQSQESRNKPPEPQQKKDDDIYARRTRSTQPKGLELPADPSHIRRIRFVPGICLTRAQEALKLFPYFPPAVCNMQGFYSPMCVRALRRFREETRLAGLAQPQAEGPQKKTRPKGDGLYSF